ncbi:MAG: dethiobiotin synthase [Deltaproteobacteria bacterium]|nr:dethiobiotin synthase [Deltaproteobacteria bacterium]
MKEAREQAPSILLIVGTDTGVGKTWTGCALARALRRSGRRVVAVKPLETGCPGPPADTEDGVLLARATGQSEPLHALLRFRDPVAPPEAADREGRQIEFEDLVRRVREYAARADISLVESAGGLLSPLTWEQSAVDLARALEARVLLVAADRLGTISHTLMALKLLELNGLEVLGVVLTAPEQPDASTGSNAAAISRLSGCSRILCAPRTHDPETISDSVQEVTQWLQLA